MGCDLDDLKESVDELKQRLRYYLECNEHKLKVSKQDVLAQMYGFSEYIDTIEGGK